MTIFTHQTLKDGLWVLPLHSMISVNEQRLVFKRPPARARKAWLCQDSYLQVLVTARYRRVFKRSQEPFVAGSFRICTHLTHICTIDTAAEIQTLNVPLRFRSMFWIFVLLLFYWRSL